MEENLSRCIDDLVEAMNFANEQFENFLEKIAVVEKIGEESHKKWKTDWLKLS